MKVLMLNGSAKPQGNTYLSLLEVGKELEKLGIEYEIFQLGGGPIRDCIGCGQCREKGAGCIFTDDTVHEFVETALSLAPRYITPTPAGGSSPSWTGSFTAAAAFSPTSPAPPWRWPGGAAPRPALT